MLKKVKSNGSLTWWRPPILQQYRRSLARWWISAINIYNLPRVCTTCINIYIYNRVSTKVSESLSPPSLSLILSHSLSLSLSLSCLPPLSSIAPGISSWMHPVSVKRDEYKPLFGSQRWGGHPRVWVHIYIYIYIYIYICMFDW